jgi:hypothetical protein
VNARDLGGRGVLDVLFSFTRLPPGEALLGRVAAVLRHPELNLSRITPSRVQTWARQRTSANTGHPIFAAAAALVQEEVRAARSVCALGKEEGGTQR